MNKFKRVIVIVLDSVGIGEMPDAAEYGDAGSNTLGNIADKVGGLKLPNLQKLGLGNIAPVKGVPPVEDPQAIYGKAALAAPNKDTTSGHWEMMGCILDFKLRTFPEGFPEEFLGKFIDATGVPGVLSNEPMSGTEVIEKYGAEHISSGKPIVYTSADSVFQIACHEEHFGLERLYETCETARELLHGDWEVGRVIARPFTGEDGDYKRTS
ncbi:MAG: phosphopentomutase, partial [Candidatus Lindowbacteria bacterium]|nr:phosphopentomutase [Candidatus Lindowbacteria bacterium]